MPPRAAAQLGLFGGVAASDSPHEFICAGGCGRNISCESALQSPKGPVCSRCFADFYIICPDCACVFTSDIYGNCPELRACPDNVDRCVRCAELKYSLCTQCGCFTLRAGRTIRCNPNDSSEEYCNMCWEGLWFICHRCEVIQGRHIAFRDPNNDNSLCRSCFSEHFYRCTNCGQSESRNNMCGCEDDPYCSTCFNNANVWKVQEWRGKATTFNKVGSKRCFGVELETEYSRNHQKLHENTSWGCVYECSTPGPEFISPILQGDEGFNEIRKICFFASDNNWTVDRSCGFHVHIDARDLSSNQLLNIAYAYRTTYPLWKKFVSRYRHGNSMCGSPQYTTRDIRCIEHFEDFSEARDRFEFVNYRAYICHGSIEIRLYQGSLAAREICNWVALHARFIDAVKDLSYDKLDETFGAITRKNWAGIVALIEDTDLLDYWRRRAKRQGNMLPAIWNDENNIRSEAESEAESEAGNEAESVRNGLWRRWPGGGETCLDSSCNRLNIDAVY